MEFQAMSWICRDVPCPDGQDDDEKELQVCVFGRTLDGRSVCLRVPYCPYFYADTPAEGCPIPASELATRLGGMVKNASPGGVQSVEVVRRKRFNGFHGDRVYPFYRIVFRTHAAYSICGSIMKKGPVSMGFSSPEVAFDTYESNVDPSIRLMHDRGLQSTGVVRVAPTAREIARGSQARLSTCDIELLCRGPADVALSDVEAVAPLVLASFDIECYSPDDSFPDFNNPEAAVIMVATTLQRYGEPEPFCRHLAVLGVCAPLETPGVRLECFATERELLHGWAQFVRQSDVDVLVGYNILGFDEEYMYKRAEASGSGQFFFLLSKLRFARSKLVVKTMSSAAYGHNSFTFFESPGIVQLDVLVAVKRGFKLDSYKLDNVARHFLGEQKHDLPPKEIFAAYRRNTPADLRLIGDYAIQDTILPLRIVSKLGLLIDNVEMAKVAGIPFEFLLQRGQGIRVYSLVLRYAMEMGYLIYTAPYLDNDRKRKAEAEAQGGAQEDEGYVGATVLEPKAGAYMDDIVACLDFASREYLTYALCILAQPSFFCSSAH